MDLVEKAKKENDPVVVNRILQEALAECQTQEDDYLKLYEQALRRKAENHLKLAKADSSACDRYNDADHAVDVWTDYIDWFVDELRPEQREIFKAKKTIFKAINGLGEAIVFRGDGAVCDEMAGTEQLFQVYRMYHPEYFNEAALDLWKGQLWLCPDWPQKRAKGLGKLLEDRICAPEKDHCQEQWREYLAFLDLWTESVDPGALSRTVSAIGFDSVKKTRARLERVFEECDQSE